MRIKARSTCAPDEHRRFLGWVAAASEPRQSTLRLAIKSLLPLLDQAGFQWLDKSFDCGNVPAHTINLEREQIPGQVDFVMFVFDEHHRPRFQVLFGRKQQEPPGWIRAGALVWKHVSESVKYKWWGPRWWRLNKESALIETIDSVKSLLPQVLRFLDEGRADQHVWESRLPQNGMHQGQV